MTIDNRITPEEALRLDSANGAESVFIIERHGFSSGIFSANFAVQFETQNGPKRIHFREIIDFSDAMVVAKHSVIPEALGVLLSMALSTSYYKAFRSTSIEISTPTNKSEITFLQTLIENGLGEYAYRNNIAEKLRPAISSRSPIRAAQQQNETRAVTGKTPLVAVGGGKDSIVSIEILKSLGMTPVLYSVNKHKAIQATVEVSGLPYISVTRRIDPVLFELNALGATNGHVPVTAMNSLIGIVLAHICDLGSVVMSNEKSANFGNFDWSGIEVNHQWSKGIYFETLLRTTLKSDGFDEAAYFSLLRKYSELQIAQQFSHYSQYFFAFTSCNRAYRIQEAGRTKGWCGECPKCQFVFLILSPYIDQQVLVSIFGNNLLDDIQLEKGFREILGLSGHKPFECVGEYSEACDALAMADSNGFPGQLVALLRRALIEADKVVDIESAPQVDYIPSWIAGRM